ncbi:protein sly1 homolog [Drosophila sulfurigaster albostrigata]|uniref:Protein sly1 homolog n=1 Tax=Drosophila albomicans TaxID=7291 RepID=A0A6P8W7L5_DROAB|nr:protein sly1 homolog [Drosophila albomicans]XP_060662341.1 protein sly1 homolog [Drosophila nasuta]XP_062122015.1 protein sly1 homolog [Drosophila sulfurigaster albostrigata]
MLSLRERQINAIKQMLNLNSQQPKALAAEPVWKILIYDRVGQDIISPIISIKELRELGVTLHVQLHSDRDSIPDVPAVYFCLPTDENLDRIQQDFSNGLYDIYHLNFLAPITRSKIENLAAAALHAGCVANIHRVYDQYVNFISLEDDFFILKHQQSDQLSYYAINRANTRDEEMEALMDSIVDSLFALFVTLGNVPIIRCPRNSAAEMVARKLEKKLRENLWDARANLFHMDATQAGGGVFSFQRPVLLLLDRNMDLATPLHHTWSYQAMVHDVLDLGLNLVYVEDEAAAATAGTRKKPKACDLDRTDRFWVTHKGSPFPTVAEAIQEELESYRNSEEEIKRLKTSMGIEGESDIAFSLVNDTTARLTNAVNSLPQLMEKKRLIDMHTKIATAILNYIKARRLDSYFEIEEKIMSKQTLDKPLLELLRDVDFGQPEDKLRLYIIYYICGQQLPEAEQERLREALHAAGCDLTSLAYVQRWKAIMNRSPSISQATQYEGGGTRTVSMFTKLVSQGSSFVMEGVKNLVVKRHNLPVTKITEQVMECRSNAETDDYLYLDPKLLKGGDVLPKNRAPFQDAVVFMVGGGNYIEYQNLVDFIKQKQTSNVNRRIIYGASTLTNARQFLKELSALGGEIQTPAAS